MTLNPVLVALARVFAGILALVVGVWLLIPGGLTIDGHTVPHLLRFPFGALLVFAGGVTLLKET